MIIIVDNAYNRKVCSKVQNTFRLIPYVSFAICVHSEIHVLNVFQNYSNLYVIEYSVQRLNVFPVLGQGEMVKLKDLS